jgi:prephenate dehydratase
MQDTLVAFQGEPGAYSEAAALEFFELRTKTYPCHSFDDVFQAVEYQLCSHGFIPIENSLAGSIHHNYDLMLRHNLYIVGEYHFRVQHCLLGTKNATLDQIKEVHSHPQALAQCEASLKRLEVNLVPEADTAGSARIIKELDSLYTAAIASQHAADVYGLKILANNMEDYPLNYTRFLSLARQSPLKPREEGQEHKTSLVFSLKNKPGSLFKALSVFALRDIDLTKIESRPIPGKPWQYMFYIDFIGHSADLVSLRAMEHLQELAPYMRILGSYPLHNLEISDLDE